MNVPKGLVSICERVREYGVESLSEEEQFDIFNIGQEAGLPFEHDSIDEYCDDVIERVAIYLSQQLAAEVPPVAIKKAAVKVPR